MLAEADQRARDADQRVQAADERAQQAERVAREAREAAQHAAASAATSTRLSEEAEVEQAAKTLLMARRTAEATVNEARGHAQAMTEEAQSRSERQLAEANAEAEELIRRAGEQADAECTPTARLRRSKRCARSSPASAQLADVISQLEARLAGYRTELTRAADELSALAEDPSRLGSRPTMSILPDEVLTSAPSIDDERPGRASRPPPPIPSLSPTPETSDTDGPDDGGARVEVIEEVSVAEEAAADPEARAAYLDLTTPSSQADQIGEADRWGPGSAVRDRCRLHRRRRGRGRVRPCRRPASSRPHPRRRRARCGIPSDGRRPPDPGRAQGRRAP